MNRVDWGYPNHTGPGVVVQHGPQILRENLRADLGDPSLLLLIFGGRITVNHTKHVLKYAGSASVTPEEARAEAAPPSRVPAGEEQGGWTRGQGVWWATQRLLPRLPGSIPSGPLPFPDRLFSTPNPPPPTHSLARVPRDLSQI